jgi:hypothetical protein
MASIIWSIKKYGGILNMFPTQKKYINKHGDLQTETL